MTRVRTGHRDESQHDNGGGGAQKARIGVYACAHRGVFHRRLDAKAVASPRLVSSTTTGRRERSGVSPHLCVTGSRGKRERDGGGGWGKLSPTYQLGDFDNNRATRTQRRQLSSLRHGKQRQEGKRRRRGVA
ncbi:hypothetical protein BHE74_00055081, partial [Ensete ventricosum]